MPNWNEIVNKNAASVVSAAFRILGNLSEAEDVSQGRICRSVRKMEAELKSKMERASPPDCRLPCNRSLAKAEVNRVVSGSYFYSGSIRRGSVAGLRPDVSSRKG